jgi:hypothetical protein
MKKTLLLSATLMVSFAAMPSFAADAVKPLEKDKKAISKIEEPKKPELAKEKSASSKEELKK